MPEESIKAKSDIGQFGIMPRWLLLSGVSGNAIKCFGILCAVFVDRNTGDAHPSRKRMAMLAGCSESSYDRYLKELESVGAVSIERRWSDDGDPLPNNITVHYVQPSEGVSSQVSTPVCSGLGTRQAVDDEQSIITKPESENHIGKAPPPKRKKGEFLALTEEQETTLRVLFPDVDVDLEIEKARAHKSHANWVVEYMGLRNWMENARKFNTPRSAAGNGTQPSSAALHNVTAASPDYYQQQRDERLRKHLEREKAKGEAR